MRRLLRTRLLLKRAWARLHWRMGRVKALDRPWVEELLVIIALLSVQISLWHIMLRDVAGRPDSILDEC